MSRMRCYYEVLQLERDCTSDEIKKQYRKLALQWHPDKNVGNEELATKNFKEITTAHAVLINPQERKWYDDHRESILSGGDGTAKSGEAEDPEENLWPFFNANCFKGFGDGADGFYAVYRDVFGRLHDDELSKGGLKSTAPTYSFGSLDSAPKEVMDFYSHWSNYVTSMAFGWADVYDVREAPNRIVKRAIEKENKKARDEAKRKYQDKVRALVTFVKGIDPRIVKIEAERKRRRAEEDALRAEQRAADLQAKKELKIRRQQQLENDEEELERRERERSRAYLLADNDDEYDELHRAATPQSEVDPEAEGAAGAAAVEEFVDHRGAAATVPRGDNLCYAFQKGQCARGDACGFRHEALGEAPAPARPKSKPKAPEPSSTHSDEEEEFFVLRCEICRKDFKSESQLEQHFSSKAHRKKEVEMASKSKGKATKAATKMTAAPEPSKKDDGDEVLSDSAQPAATAGMSKKALKKRNKKLQTIAFSGSESSDGADDDAEGVEPETIASASVAVASTFIDAGDDSDDDSSSSED